MELAERDGVVLVYVICSDMYRTAKPRIAVPVGLRLQ